jgi:hypothetical protein
MPPLVNSPILAYSMSYVFTFTCTVVQREVNHSFYLLVYRSVSYLLSSTVQKSIISYILYSVQKCIISLSSSVKRYVISSTILDIEIYPIFHPPGKQDVTFSSFKARDVPYLLSCTASYRYFIIPSIL